jgi:hypothetical protein
MLNAPVNNARLFACFKPETYNPICRMVTTMGRDKYKTSDTVAGTDDGREDVEF